MDYRFADNLLFKGIPESIVRDLNITVEECCFEAGEVIFEEGDNGDHVFLVLKGEIRISKKGRGGKQEVLSVQTEGGFFGEMAILDGSQRSARATAASNTTLGRIDQEEMEKFLSHSAETARRFATIATEQLRNANSIFINKLIQTERLSLLGTMMTAIVHDLRNPIATLGMLGHYLSNQDDPVISDLGSVADEALEQIKSMIQELLDFSRGTSKLNLEPVAVPDLMKKLDEQILRKVEGSGVNVHREILYTGVVTIDFHRLLRLLLNIVKNAWEAMGGNGQLTIRISQSAEVVEFRIQDTGCGIPTEVLAKVFEPFVTHGKSSGTGLGMAIAKSVVEAHRGKIRMESELDKGTTCFITLPLLPPEEATEEVNS